MSVFVQSLIVGTLVALAAVWLGRQLYVTLHTGKGGGSCCSEKSCSQGAVKR